MSTPSGLDNQLLAAIVDTFPQAVVAMDLQGRVVHANEVARRWLGLYAATTTLTPAHQALDDTTRQQLFTQHWPAALRGEVLAISGAHLQVNGQSTPVRFQLRPLLGTDGAQTGVLLLLENATPDQSPAEIALRRLQATLEEQVQQRTAELQQARDEMEAFSYSVSHDLRTPLSAVDGFSSMLDMALNDLPPEQAVDCLKYLSRIRAGVKQMGELIDALLSLARLSRAELRFGLVDLSQQATQVLSALHEREPARATRFDVQPGLLAYGDARLLKQLLDNLLGNAWKFSRYSAVTQIEVGWAPEVDGGAFFVRDHGAGFDMAYAERLFNPFQRLHSPAEYEGTGIGLATVHRIVARHGGQVRGESATGQGATFYFTLPSEPTPDRAAHSPSNAAT